MFSDLFDFQDKFFGNQIRAKIEYEENNVVVKGCAREKVKTHRII